MSGTDFRSSGPELERLTEHFNTRAEQLIEGLETAQTEFDLAKLNLFDALRRFTDCRDALQQRSGILSEDLSTKAVSVDSDEIIQLARESIGYANFLLQGFEIEQ